MISRTMMGFNNFKLLESSYCDIYFDSKIIKNGPVKQSYLLLNIVYILNCVVYSTHACMHACSIPCACIVQKNAILPISSSAYFFSFFFFVHFYEKIFLLAMVFYFFKKMISFLLAGLRRPAL